jgi:hypothetical protein
MKDAMGKQPNVRGSSAKRQFAPCVCAADGSPADKNSDGA